MVKLELSEYINGPVGLELSVIQIIPRLPEVSDILDDKSCRIGDTAGGKDGQRSAEIIRGNAFMSVSPAISGIIGCKLPSIWTAR